MSSSNAYVDKLIDSQYQHGFVTDIESEKLAKGLNEDVIKYISKKKGEPEFLLKWRLESYENWLTMQEPDWSSVNYSKIDYQDIIYYSAPKSMQDKPKSLDEVDPKLLETYNKLGIPLYEQKIMAYLRGDS